jgi:hypothetical protein
MLRIFGPTLLLLLFADVALADDPVFPPLSCKVDRKELEAAIERYKSGEDSSVFLHKSYFMFCRSTRPVLKKYITDADPTIRDMIASFLCCNHRKYNLLLLVTQIEMFPFASNYARHQLSFYEPSLFLRVEAKRLAGLRDALIKYELERVRNGEDAPTGDTVTILKKLAAKDSQARQFLAERGQTLVENVSVGQPNNSLDARLDTLFLN